MAENTSLSTPPPLPTRPKSGGWRLALQVLGWILIGYAGLLLVTSIPVALIGGPMEPPSNMSMEEFSKWKDSGAWLKSTLWTVALAGGAGLVLVIAGRKGNSRSL